MFTIYGIDITANCDTCSNLDFVTFIWQNFERFNFVRYALTHVRRDYLALLEMLCLKYYRAESGGWRNDILCGMCIARFHTRFQHATSYLRTSDCRCTVCARQPPSLLGLASNHLFQLSRTRYVRTDQGNHIRSVCSDSTFTQGICSPASSSRLS